MPSNTIEPSRRGMHAHDRLQRRRLAGTVAPEQRHHFAGRHVEVDAVQDLRFAVPGREAAHREQRRGPGTGHGPGVDDIWFHAPARGAPCSDGAPWPSLSRPRIVREAPRRWQRAGRPRPHRRSALAEPALRALRSRPGRRRSPCRRGRRRPTRSAAAAPSRTRRRAAWCRSARGEPEMGEPVVERAGTRSREQRRQQEREVDPGMREAGTPSIDLHARARASSGRTRRGTRRAATSPRYSRNVEHRPRAGRRPASCVWPPMPWIRMFASALAALLAQHDLEAVAEAQRAVGRPPPRRSRSRGRGAGRGRSSRCRRRRSARARAAARRSAARQVAPAPQPLLAGRRRPSGRPAGNRRGAEDAASGFVGTPACQQPVDLSQPLLQLPRLAERLLQHPLVDLVAARTGSMRLAIAVRARQRPAAAAAAAAGNGTPRPSRRRAAARPAARAPASAQPRRGPGLGDAVRQREHARRVDEQPRAARLEVERALDAPASSSTANVRIRPSGGSTSQRVLHHEAQEHRVVLRVAEQPLAQRVARASCRRRAAGSRTRCSR